MRNILIASLILIIAVAAFACSAPQTQAPAAQNAANGNVVASPPPIVGDGAPTGDVKEFKIDSFNFGFTPESISVKKGDRVRIVLTSSSGRHGVAIPDFGVASVPVGEGESQTIEFTADKTGSFPFFCNVPCGPGHRSMRGTIVVSA